MAKKKKNSKGIPRRKRLSRDSRLQSGKLWLRQYEGKNVVKGYSNWFGVSKVCSISELRMFGVSVPDERLEQAKLAERLLEKPKARNNEENSETSKALYESDENYYFIAGYTSGGVPYGLTWEEANSIDEDGLVCA